METIDTRQKKVGKNGNNLLFGLSTACLPGQQSGCRADFKMAKHRRDKVSPAEAPLDDASFT